MLDDKKFLESEITPHIAELVDNIKILISHRVTIEKIYKYILTYSRDYKERYIVMFLFGIAYQGYKEDNCYK